MQACREFGSVEVQCEAPCVCAADIFNFEAFGKAMSVVLAFSAYLPSAGCFALLPFASQVALDETLSLFLSLWGTEPATRPQISMMHVRDAMVQAAICEVLQRT